MTWTKLSDDFADDCWTLSDKAYRLHTEGLMYSNRKLLNLEIPKDDLRRFAKHPDAVKELVSGGWWRDHGACYVILHHGAYQRDRAAVIKQQIANSRNGARGGRPAGSVREQFAPKSESGSVSNSLSQPSSEPLNDSTGERDRPGRARIEALLESEILNSEPGVSKLQTPHDRQRMQASALASLMAARKNDPESALHHAP